MNGLVLALAISAGVQDDADKLSYHRSALPADIRYEPYSHARVVRWNGQRQVAQRATTHKRDFGRFENPFRQTPCNAEMFRAPGGGLTSIKDIEVQKWRYIPGPIATYRAGHGEHYVYPIGTRFAETIAHRGRVFEVRCLHKVADKQWEFDVDTATETPPGYVAVTNCVDCHRFAGTTANRIPDVDDQHWWGYGDMIGDDMVISHDPRQMRNARIR